MDLLDGLVGHWPLDRQSYDQATHQFADKSAEGNHGTGNGDNLGDTFNFHINQHGIGSSAVSFDGDSDYINCGNPDSLNITDELTICSWTNTEQDGGILTKDKPNNGRGYSHRIASSRLNFIACSSAGVCGQRKSSSMIYTEGVWVFTTSVYNGSNQTIDLYGNGVLDNGILTGTVPTSIKVVSTPVILGQYYNYDGSKFRGKISNVRIYNHALSQDEITWLYLEQAGVYKTTNILKPLDKPVRISKERSLIVLKKGENCGI